MLLDPLEKQFYLPATLVQLGNGQGRKRKVVGQKDEQNFRFGIAVADLSQFFWIVL